MAKTVNLYEAKTQLKGQIWIAGDFDDDLPPEILAGYLGEDESAGDA